MTRLVAALLVVGAGLASYTVPFSSTLAFQGGEGDLVLRDGAWVHEPSGARLDDARGGPARSAAQRLEGFDTYWYMWSLTHPDTRILETIRN